MKIKALNIYNVRNTIFVAEEGKLNGFDECLGNFIMSFVQNLLAVTRFSYKDRIHF